MRDFNEAEIDRIMGEVDKEVLAVTGEVAGTVIDDLVQRSPVLTGAYRASHAVLGGTSILYEGPERPGGDEIIKVGSRAILEPPDGSDATISVIGNGTPYQRIEVWNGRFYASLIEYGSASMAPRTIYGTAEANGEAAARQIAEKRRVIL